MSRDAILRISSSRRTAALFRKDGRQAAWRAKMPRGASRSSSSTATRAGCGSKLRVRTLNSMASAAILTVARDVSHRKSLEVSLSRSKRQAQYTLESIAEGVITTDNDGPIDYMNLAAETLIGTSRDDAAGHKRQRAVHACRRCGPPPAGRPGRALPGDAPARQHGPPGRDGHPGR